MKAIRFAIPALALFPMLAPPGAFAASKEIIELQRDIAQLQESMRQLQTSFDSKIAQIQVLVQQSLDSSNRANGAIGEMSRGIQNSGANVTQHVQQPIAAMGQRLDGMSQDLQSVQQQVADQNSKLQQIQQQLGDLKQMLQVIQNPPTPPPSGVNPSPDSSITGPAGSAAGMPPVPATQLWANAKHDMDGKNDDLAINEFQQYLKFYRNNDLAPNAQYNIGEIHYRQTKLEEAVKDFDQVLEAFPVNPKTPDAHYMKGRALIQLGRRNEAAKEFQAVLNQFPNSVVAANCKASLRALGLSPSAPATQRTRKQ